LVNDASMILKDVSSKKHNYPTISYHFTDIDIISLFHLYIHFVYKYTYIVSIQA
jgi:hypothetical protein